MRGFWSRWCLAAGVLAITCAIWLLAGIHASAGLPVLAASEIPAETTASASQRQAGEATGQQTPPDLEAIDTLIREGHYPEAEAAAREALSGLEVSGQSETLDAARYSDRLVEALLQGGKGSRPEAMTRARFAFDLKESTIGPNDVETARSQERLGRVLTSALDFDEAQRQLEHALGVLESAPGGANLDVASVQESIGRISFFQSRFDSAREWFEKALAVRVKLAGPDDFTVANTLRLLGECASELNDLPLATELLQRSKQIYELAGPPEHPDLARPLTALGQVLRAAGDYAQAKSHLERAVRLLDASFGPDSPRVAHSLSALGLVLTDMGDFTLAARSFERALAVETREFGTEHWELAATLDNFGILRMGMGDYAGAERLFVEAVRLNEKFRGPWNLDTASSIESHGIALAEQGRYAEAEPHFVRALEIRIKVIGEDKPLIVNSLHNLSILSGVLGDYAKQKNYALRALTLMDRLGDKNGYRRGAVMNSLALSSRGLGDLASAVDFSGQQLAAMQTTFGPFHPEVADALHLQARLLAEDGKYADGVAAAVQSENMSRDHVALTARTATEEDALRHAATRSSSLGLLVTIAELDRADAIVTASTAWDAVVRARALIFDEMLARRGAMVNAADPELTRRREELSETTGRLAKLIVKGPGSTDALAFQAEMKDARDAKDRAEEKYAERNEQFRRQLAMSRTGISEVVSRLPRDSALVAFVQYGRVDVSWPAGGKAPEIDESSSSYAAFVLTGTESVPKVVQIGTADQVNALVERLRRSLKQEMIAGGRATAAGEAAHRKVAEEVRRLVWDPVAAKLGNPGRIFIVPDGALNLVDFEALPTGETQYLAETLPPLHYLSSERDLLMDAPISDHGQLLALGAPDFEDTELFASLRGEPVRLTAADVDTTAILYRGPRSACDSFQSMNFEPLPATSREVAEVLGLWRQGAGNENNATILTGAAASETAFKQRAAGKRVLHLATHGFFLGGECGSALEPQQSVVDVARENPLLLSGLVLAGANHRAAAGPGEDDGILTAEEIATLDLSDNEWAVLSACDTGRGEIRNGEGVLGLQRAFRMAGARTIIMSLWPVEDAVARDWMSVLYRRHFVDGRNTMDSVHDASLELLAGRRARGLSTHPFYWAGFVASGDWQ